VNSLVIAEICLLRESFLAVVADVLLVGRVISDVVEERSLSVEDFLTKRTLSFLAEKYLAVHIHQSLLQLKCR
jgi:hypothetical protein